MKEGHGENRLGTWAAQWRPKKPAKQTNWLQKEERQDKICSQDKGGNNQKK